LFFSLFSEAVAVASPYYDYDVLARAEEAEGTAVLAIGLVLQASSSLP